METDSASFPELVSQLDYRDVHRHHGGRGSACGMPGRVRLPGVDPPAALPRRSLGQEPHVPRSPPSAGSGGAFRPAGRRPGRASRRDRPTRSNRALRVATSAQGVPIRPSSRTGSPGEFSSALTRDHCGNRSSRSRARPGAGTRRRPSTGPSGSIRATRPSAVAVACRPMIFYEPERRDRSVLPHDPFKSLVAPRPIGWISTADAAGRINLAPYSFFNAIADGRRCSRSPATGRQHVRPASGDRTGHQRWCERAGDLRVRHRHRRPATDRSLRRPRRLHDRGADLPDDAPERVARPRGDPSRFSHVACVRGWDPAAALRGCARLVL